MRFKTVTSFAFISICAVIMTVSCSRYSIRHRPSVSKGKGPPAHAPAHGYRRKHVAGMELVFDSGRGVYVVFYRLRGGLWEMSLKPDGDWKAASEKSLPMGLQVKVKTNGNGKGNGKGKVKHKKDIAKIGRLF